MVQCSLEELNWLVENNPNGVKVPRVGECIDVEINELLGNSIVVKCVGGSHLQGVARTMSPPVIKVIVLSVRRGGPKRPGELPRIKFVVFVIHDCSQGIYLDSEALRWTSSPRFFKNSKIWIRELCVLVSLGFIDFSGSL